MIGWELLTEETAKEVWDKNLIRLADCSPFQTFAWGLYNRALGWQPCYFAAFDENGEISAMCLGLLRRYPFKIGLIWCVGGPVGDIRFWNENLRKTVLKSTGLKHLYFRFRCDRYRDINDVLFLDNANWSRTNFIMTSGMSMELDLSQTEEKLRAGLSSSWRRNLKLSQKNNLVIKQCPNPDIDELCRVFAEMEAQKNLPQLFSHEKLENLFKHAKEILIFFRCENEEGELLCFRACLIVGNRVIDYFAATTEKARKLRASYATLWELFLESKRRGAVYYDLGGINPWMNPGVYTFKKETGARETESLGEWDWATSEALRFFGNWAIQSRQKAKPVKAKTEFSSISKLSEWIKKSLGWKKNIKLERHNLAPTNQNRLR